jgi:nucleolar protein 58
LALQMARMVATKAALSIRVDALGDADSKSSEDAASIGIGHRAKLESRLRALEYQADGATVRRFAESGKKQQQRFSMSGETKTYNSKADEVMDEDFVTTQRDSPMEAAVKVVLDVKEEKRKAKEERRAKKKADKEKAADTTVDADAMDVDGESPAEKKDKKEKKRKRRESQAAGAVADEEPEQNGAAKEETEEERKAKKKAAKKAEKAAAAAAANGESSPPKKKKKKADE